KLSLPFFVESQNERTSGTWVPPLAGFGLATVLAHSQAITVSSWPVYSARSGRSMAISLVTCTFGYRRAEAPLMVFSGRATSISFLGGNWVIANLVLSVGRRINYLPRPVTSAVCSG